MPICQPPIRKEEEEGESVLGNIDFFMKIMKTRLRRQLFASGAGTIFYHKLDSHCCCWRRQTKEETQRGRQGFSLKTDSGDYFLLEYF